MHVVAVNSARSTYRRMKNQATAHDPLETGPLDKPDPRTTSVIAGTRLDLLEAMETIEKDHPQFVEPLLLRDVYGLSYEEIAQQVGAPLGTIKAQIHHGRKLARPLLRGERVRLAPAVTAGVATAALPARRVHDGGRPAGRLALRGPVGIAGSSRDVPEGSTAPTDGVSTPVEDRVYPDVGDPGVDALHYDLDLDWTPATRTLDGRRDADFRATADADHVPARPGAGRWRSPR